MSNAVTQLAKIIKSKLVRTVGGQKPDSDGNINMEGYALKSDVDGALSKRLVMTTKRAIPTIDNPTAFVDMLVSNAIPEGASLVRDEHPNVTTKGATAQPLNTWVYKEGLEALYLYAIGVDQQGALWTFRIISGVAKGWKKVPSVEDVAALNNKITALQAQLSGGGADA